MPAIEADEKTYYSDAITKVTNVRVTCNHITVPVEKIESVDVNFRIEAFSFSVLVFLSSFTPFLFFNFVPDLFKPPFAILGLILIAATLMWLIMVFKSYVELIVSIGGRSLVIFSANMKRKDYICKIAAAIGDAISDEKKYQKMKQSEKGNPSESPLNSSETIRLKLMLEDYEKLAVMKDRIGKAGKE